MKRPQPDAAFRWTRKVPPEWQADLDRLVAGENVSRLVLVWQPGVEWNPIQRWEIYEVVPAKTMESICAQEAIMGGDFMDSLWGPRTGVRGPDPASVGQWVYDGDVPQGYGNKRWRSSSMVSRTQWLLHQQTGGMPHRCWIIEGSTGGHAWNLGQFERTFLLAAGSDPQDVQALADTWPDPGSLPYAEYDQRVFTMLTERDQLRQWRESLRWQDRTDRGKAADHVLVGMAQRRRAMMERVIRFIDNQVGAFASDVPRTIRSRIPGTALSGDHDADTPGQRLLEG